MLHNLKLIDRLSVFLGSSPDAVLASVKIVSSRYKIYEIPKHSGGKRTILHPCRELKAFQYAVNEIILSSYDVHPIAYAYIPNKKSPLRASAELHAPYRYSIRIDFKDFFHSIFPDNLISIIENKFNISNLDRFLIEKILFYKGKLNVNGHPFLPIGAPTSPAISNIVMIELDSKFFETSKEIDRNSAISRYADDLYFSTNEKGRCQLFWNSVYELLRETQSPRLEINGAKTLYLSRGTKRVVNGLFVTPDGKVSIGRERKSKIKSLIYKHSQGALFGDALKQAQGLLAFIQDCEPSFYNRLAQKYGENFYSFKDANVSGEQEKRG